MARKSTQKEALKDLHENGFNLEHEQIMEAEALDADLEAIEGTSKLALELQEAIDRYNEELELETPKLEAYEAAVQVALSNRNVEEKTDQLNSWAGHSEPVKTCLLNGGTYSLSNVSKHKDTGIMSLVGKSAIVDLKDLWGVKKDAFADKKWLLYAEAANVAIRDYIASVMGIKTLTDKLGKFKLSASASLLNITLEDMKTSKGTKAALQRVVDSIVGSEKYEVTSEDAEAFRFNYTSWGSKSITGVSMSIESTFRKQLTRILVRIVNNTEYIGE